MLVECIVKKEFNIDDFIKWLTPQKIKNKTYHQLLDTYIKSVYNDVLYIDDWAKEDIILLLPNAFDSDL